jgi:hypothetical protein
MSPAVIVAMVGSILLLVLVEFRDAEFTRRWYQDRRRVRRNLWYTRWPEPAPGERQQCYGTGLVDKLPFGFWEEMAYFLRSRGAPANGSAGSAEREPHP